MLRVADVMAISLALLPVSQRAARRHTSATVDNDTPPAVTRRDDTELRQPRRPQPRPEVHLEQIATAVTELPTESTESLEHQVEVKPSAPETAVAPSTSVQHDAAPITVESTPMTAPPAAWSDDIARALLAGHFGRVVAGVALADADAPLDVPLSSMTTTASAHPAAEEVEPRHMAVALLCPESAVSRFYFVPPGQTGVAHLQFLWMLLASDVVDVTLLNGAVTYQTLLRHFGTVAFVGTGDAPPQAVPFVPRRVRDLSVLAAVVHRMPASSSLADYASAAGVPLDGAEDVCRVVAAAAVAPLVEAEHRMLAALAMLHSVSDALQRQADADGSRLAVDLDTETAYVTQAMEYHGVPLSPVAGRSLLTSVQEQVKTLETLLIDQAKFHAQQLQSPTDDEPIDVDATVAVLLGTTHSARATALLDTLQLKTMVPPFVASGGGSTPSDASQPAGDFGALLRHLAVHSALGHALLDVLTARANAKRLAATLSSALSPISVPSDDAANAVRLVHPTYDTYLLSETGRIFGARPSLQTLPKSARGCVVAPTGTVLVSIDFNQIELRVLAALSRDEALLRAFRNGEDVLARVAKSMRGNDVDPVTPLERQAAKTVAYGLLYGLGDALLQQRLDSLRPVASDAGGVVVAAMKASAVRAAFFQSFPGVRDWLSDVHDSAAFHRSAQSAVSGRKRLYGSGSAVGFASFAEQSSMGRRAVSLHVQGGAADLLKAALVAAWPATPEDAVQYAVLTPLHDEILFAVDTTHLDRVVPRLVAAMSIEAPRRVGLDELAPLPLTVQCGPSWGAMAGYVNATPPGNAPTAEPNK